MLHSSVLILGQSSAEHVTRRVLIPPPHVSEHSDHSPYWTTSEGSRSRLKFVMVYITGRDGLNGLNSRREKCFTTTESLNFTV